MKNSDEFDFKPLNVKIEAPESIRLQDLAENKIAIHLIIKKLEEATGELNKLKSENDKLKCTRIPPLPNLFIAISNILGATLTSIGLDKLMDDDKTTDIIYLIVFIIGVLLCIGVSCVQIFNSSVAKWIYHR